ncbi:hypothetical protein I6J18_01715 [Peribacillus psychrosaccharolyticus]|uniref:DUF4878 domain-containing protein n=1 Tax=Peribacillus psychrosaccharolyticus TaxID=1407 RepID=A0A974NMY0_PERPY|nr:hypothetical protein [Peribacillus psychrosaccharolyticus]MEC2056129.1 hypothetical protein [Peribacillus psychrosaccharolyticus]MED3745570.1 hypothetical protein [Peribacillus psychrosaccharolyticus]QQT00678.1 hypothetical protein I6J18_01715 [Peribacillus psychrosaccharolyticus]
MIKKQMLMSVATLGMIALTACQSPDKPTNVKEKPKTELSEENTNEETLRASAIKKTIYGYYETMNTLNGEEMFSYLALDGELKEGSDQSAISILQEELDEIEEETLVEQYTLLESDKDSAKVKVSLLLVEPNLSRVEVSELILEDGTWKIKSGKYYDLVLQKMQY